MEVSGTVRAKHVLRQGKAHRITFEDEATRQLLSYTVEGSYCPVMVGDRISGVYDMITKKFECSPRVHWEPTKASVLSAMRAIVPPSAASPVELERLYAWLLSTYQTASAAVNKLSSMSQEYEENRTVGRCIPEAAVWILRQAAWKILLEKWNEKVMNRNLYLLGIFKRDIKRAEMRPSQLYERVLANPYTLPTLTEEKCEQIDQMLNRTSTQEERRCGKILRAVFQKTARGMHTYVPLADVERDMPWCRQYVDRFPDYALRLVDERRVYYEPIYERERYVADRIVAMKERGGADALCEAVISNEKLTREQRDAVNVALNAPISIITGRPGTGKTTTLCEIVGNLEMMEVDYALLSFTGKAVERIKEVVKRPAWTMDQFKFKKLDKLDYVIIDEMSMVTLRLFSQFLKCLERFNVRLVLIGDADQLPPIGYGFVFNELLKVHEIERVTLTAVKRIDDVHDQHGIYLNCDRVLNAPQPPCKMQQTPEFYLLDPGRDNCIAAIQYLRDNGVNQDEIAIITPYRKAAEDINEAASTIFHPNAPETDRATTFGHMGWRTGDKVIMTTNNHTIDVMNGSSGVIESMDDKHLHVQFRAGNFAFRYRRYPGESDGGEDSDDNDEEPTDSGGGDTDTPEDKLTTKTLIKGYALTVHKAQGNEYSFVIAYFPYVKERINFVNKNMIYTMFSRAKEAVYLVPPEEGGREILERKAAYTDRHRRNDWLARAIKAAMPDPSPDYDEE